MITCRVGIYIFLSCEHAGIDISELIQTLANSTAQDGLETQYTRTNINSKDRCPI